MVSQVTLPVELAALAERIVAALNDEAVRLLGHAPALSELSFAQVIDPGNQLPGYEGVWRNAQQAHCGCLIFNSDGSFYAEYDLFCPHPSDPRWFIEMVTAWGRADSLRVEAQMIPGIVDA